MRLENIAIDAVNPVRVAEFWEAALGAERQFTSLDLLETRLTVPDGPWFDICIQQVPTPPAGPLRLHLDLLGGERQEETVDQLLSLGAEQDFLVSNEPAQPDAVHRHTVEPPAPGPLGIGGRRIRRRTES